MSLATSVLADDSLRVTGDGLELDVYPNWYRSLPLSSLETVELTVDGRTVGRDELTFVVGGVPRTFAELNERWDELWFVLDPVTLRVGHPLVKPGEPASISLVLGNRIPYLLVGPDQPLEVVTETSRTLVAR